MWCTGVRVWFEQVPCFRHVTWWVESKPFTRGASSPAHLPFFALPHPAPAVSPPPPSPFLLPQHPSMQGSLETWQPSIPDRIATSTICFDLFIVNGYPHIHTHTSRAEKPKGSLFLPDNLRSARQAWSQSTAKPFDYHSLKLPQRHPPHHHGSRYQLEQQAPCRGPGYRKILLLDS
jgi:hypothetical protein